MENDLDTQMLEALERVIKLEIPKYERRVKEDSRLMRAANLVVGLFNKHFMTHYVTTVYPYVYVSQDRSSGAKKLWKTLAHEWVHLRHAQRLTPFLYSILYLFPQSLAVLSLLSVGAYWGSAYWLLNLLWLLCLAPIPALFRAEDEFRAYTMSLAIDFWLYGIVRSYAFDTVAENFYGQDYYWMWPSKKCVEKRLNKEIDRITSGYYDNIEPYKTVKETIKALWKTPLPENA